MGKSVRLLLGLIFCVLLGSVSCFAFECHVLSVGQGQSVLIEADGHYMLIDGGGRDTSSFVVRYLSGIDKLDCIAVTHYDEDHYAGIIGILNTIPCDLLIAPPYAGEGDLYESLAAGALSNGCTITHGKSGMEFEVGDAEVEIIGPTRLDYLSDNNLSLCFRVGFGENHFLICGDAEKEAELDMVLSGAKLSSDVYVVNHHGSYTSSMDTFLDAVNPGYAIISCGKDNGYGHPAMETLQRLLNHGISMFRTDEQGTVIAYSDGHNIWFNQEPSENWMAGSVTDRLMPIDVAEQEIEKQETETQEIEKQGTEYTYVCNTNTKKFHYPSCKSVDQMKEENRLFTGLSREELLMEGYTPCGNCNP